MDSIDAFFSALESAGLEAAAQAMTRGAEKGATKAKEKAPVRMVFQGQSDAVQMRLKSIGEIDADRHVRATLGLGPESAWINPPSVVTKNAPRMLRMRGVIQTPGGNLMSMSSAQSMLDRRGRWELKSGRAVHKDQLGGRLRDEIYADPATADGHIIKARIVSPTPYAKFMEFGTRHAAARPYLRAAGHEVISSVRDDVRRSVSAAARTATAGGLRINVRPAKLKVVG